MHPIDIQSRLKKRGISQKGIAIDAGVSEMAISLVIRKLSVSDRLMKMIAGRIEMDHREVFPEYYLRRRQQKAA